MPDKVKVKFTMTELESVSTSLAAIMPRDIPARPAYWIGKLFRKVTSELKHFDDTRMRLLKKYAAVEEGELKLDANQQAVFESDEKKEEFFKEFTKIKDEIEVELEIVQININDLGDVKLAPGHLYNLEKIFTE